jgi:hypothetical protein
MSVWAARLPGQEAEGPAQLVRAALVAPGPLGVLLLLLCSVSVSGTWYGRTGRECACNVLRVFGMFEALL